MLNVILVNYGSFDNNSGNHIANFANELVKFGHKVTVIASGEPETIEEFHAPRFECCSADDLILSIPYNLRKTLRVPNTVIHCWTPRQVCIELVDRMRVDNKIPYFIHFEDNEEEITYSSLYQNKSRGKIPHAFDSNLIIPKHLTHPGQYLEFVRNATGITGIVASLKEFIPDNVPFHVLEPGVDSEKFCSDLSNKDLIFLRKYFYIPDNHKIVVYPGNMHNSNRNDIFSMYLAMYLLRKRGHNITLIRTGIDYVPHLDVSIKELKKHNIIELGHLSYLDLMAVLKISDFFVQPGKPDRFNKYRLPSKIPEFLSLARPTIMPNTNIGLMMEHKFNAMLMERGDAKDITQSLEELISDNTLCNQLGYQARQFAIENLDWKKKTHSLIEFYHSLLL